MCKMISPANFSFFKILIFGVFRGIHGTNDLKLPISVYYAPYLRNCRSYRDFDNNIYMCFSFFFFKCNFVNIEIICFLLAHFSSFFNNYLFFKFINKFPKEMLRCASPSHVCDFLHHVLLHN